MSNATTKHTPGPWTVDYSGPSRLAIMDDAYRVIAFGNLQNEIADEDEANARLIAAAPEMRASIERMITALEDCEAGECEEAREARALLARIDGTNG